MSSSATSTHGVAATRAVTMRASSEQIEHDGDQHQRAGPRLPVPVLVRRNGVGVDLDRQRRDRLRRMSVEKNRLLNAVNSSGAVSPAMRASASTTPVMMPGQRRRHDHARTPPAPASRRAPARLRAALPGTRSSSSSVVRAMIGIIMTPSARPPAMRAELPERQHREAVGEDADDDRRHAVQRVRREAHRRREAGARRIRTGRRR